MGTRVVEGELVSMGIVTGAPKVNGRCYHFYKVGEMVRILKAMPTVVACTDRTIFMCVNDEGNHQFLRAEDIALLD